MILLSVSRSFHPWSWRSWGCQVEGYIPTHLPSSPERRRSLWLGSTLPGSPSKEGIQRQGWCFHRHQWTKLAPHCYLLGFSLFSDSSQEDQWHTHFHILREIWAASRSDKHTCLLIDSESFRPYCLGFHAPRSTRKWAFSCLQRRPRQFAKPTLSYKCSCHWNLGPPWWWFRHV